MSDRPFRRPGFALHELLICLALASALAVALGAAARQTRETENRVRCAANLRTIGQAMLLYANENNNQYPRTFYKRDAKLAFGTPYTDKPDLGPSPQMVNPYDPKSPVRPADNDVTAAYFMLLRTQDFTPKVFVCPTTDQTPMDLGGAQMTTQNWVNWPGAKGIRQHLSYSFQNPYPSTKAITNGARFSPTVGADYALASDVNPGGDAVLKVRPDSPADALRAANSGNHGGDGQNVLYGDGHVAFVQTPFCGPSRDNIFAYRDGFVEDPFDTNAHAAGTVGSSFDANDCVLLPTAEQFKLPRVKLPAGDDPDTGAESSTRQ